MVKKLIKQISMLKMPIRISLVGISIAIIVILLVWNYQTYIMTSQRFLEIFDITNLKNFFENYLASSSVIYEEAVGEITEGIDIVIGKIGNMKPIEEIILDVVTNTIVFIVNFLNYFCNIGINVIMLLMIYYHETFAATNLNIKYSKAAKVFLKLQRLVHFIWSKIKSFLKFTKKSISRHRRKIALVLLIFLLGRGLLYQFLVEVLIFFITYIYHAIKLETFIVLSSFGQALLLIIYPKIKLIPKLVLIILIVYMIFIRAFQKANLRLRKNHERLKLFALERLTQTTFINGAPGVGKTLLNLSLTLASEENYIEILQNLMLEYELKYPEVNFAKIRKKPDDYKEHKDYIQLYEFLNNRGTFIISNYAIFSPYFKEYSKIFDFNYMRKNIKTDIYPLEEYIIISISELDKE